jgi:hypothetical protein
MPVISTIAAATARAFGAFKSAAGGAVDEFFDYVTLLLHGDGTNGAQNNSFQDSSTNNFQITRNGNTTQGTFSPFSQTGWSNYFDGSGDYCTFSSNSAMDFGTGAFTIEAWIYTGDKTVSGGASRTIIGNSGNSYTMQLYIDSSVGKVVFGNTGSTNLQGTSNVANNAWNHVVVVRSGTGTNQTAIFVNGSREAVGTNTQNYTSGTIYLGAFDTGNGFWNGYISNLRIVKGTAVYDPTQTTLTVPTTPLTAIANTSLLTCQSNRFRDASTNNFAITVNGNTSVQAFSPFAPTAAYSAATVGGSGYFDGSGDYLTFAPGSAFAFGTGDFTVEWWMNTNGVTLGAPGIVEPASNGSYWAMRFVGTTFYYQSAAGITTLTSVSIPTSNQSAWTHMAVVRISGTTKIYANGVQVQSVADTTNYTGTVNYQIGRTSDPNANVYSGWLTDVRVVKGTAVYTSAFTPPTAPLTAITNTSLLLNFTNAGIIDNTAKNVLETVGNAQISTSVKKFGTGSLAFDGTGDWLVVPDTPALRMESGNFTIEFWINWTSISGYQTPLDKGYTSAGGLLFQTGNGNGRFVIYASGSAVITESGTASTGTWIHYALVRNGTTLTLYRDGTSVGSATNSTNFNITTQLLVGANNAGSGTSIGQYPFNGYIDDLRITKGIARYTTTFTPPTAAFADQ